MARSATPKRDRSGPSLFQTTQADVQNAQDELPAGLNAVNTCATADCRSSTASILMYRFSDSVKARIPLFSHTRSAHRLLRPTHSSTQPNVDSPAYHTGKRAQAEPRLTSASVGLGHFTANVRHSSGKRQTDNYG